MKENFVAGSSTSINCPLRCTLHVINWVQQLTTIYPELDSWSVQHSAILDTKQFCIQPVI